MNSVSSRVLDAASPAGPRWRPILAAALTFLVLTSSGCGDKPIESPRRFTESLMVDIQERAFDRLYDKLTRQRQREMAREEYIRYNRQKFEQLDRIGGYFDDWWVIEQDALENQREASMIVRVDAVFPRRDGPSRHQKSLVFELLFEDGEWKFDGFRSYDSQ